MATYPGVFGSLDEVKERARWYLTDRNRGMMIPTCCRVEDDKEDVVAVYDWDDATSKPVLRESTSTKE